MGHATMTDAPLYARATDVVATELEGTVVLLNTQSWVYLEFDKVGSAIWGLLERPATLPALVTALTGKYEVEPAQCQVDTKSFLDEMIEQGVVTVSAA
jgi:Coenzyme PQQ synthesis protein D (PqqD)